MHKTRSLSRRTLPTTRHARIRCQQRGIPMDLVELLFEFGHERHVGGGATMLSFPKRSRETMRRRLSRERFAAISSRLGVYAVLGDDGYIVTVGHRFQPIREKKH